MSVVMTFIVIPVRQLTDKLQRESRDSQHGRHKKAMKTFFPVATLKPPEGRLRCGLFIFATRPNAHGLL